MEMMMTMMKEMMKAEFAAMRKENAATLKSQVEAQVRSATRRSTVMMPLGGPGTPLPSPPRVSGMTHQGFSQLRTPAVMSTSHVFQAQPRRSLGASINRFELHGDVDGHVEEEEDVLDSEEEEERKMESQPSSTVGRGQRRRTAEDDREAAKLAKIMAKRPPPAVFTGEKESEKDAVEQWVIDANGYLDSQFGQLDEPHPKERMQLIRSYIKGAAAHWVTSALSINANLTWEQLQEPFVEFIRGGRASRQLWLEKMKMLAYGKGKCKDMLALEQEFDILSVKLYPTMGDNVAINEVVGREFADCIKRGDSEVYLEMLRIIGVQDNLLLADWKTAAAKAVAIVSLTRASRGHGQRQKWGSNTPSSAVVAEISTENGEEGEEQLGVELQQVQGQRASGARSTRGPYKSRGPYIPEDQWKIVLSKGLCWQCYKPGHRKGDDECKDKGKPKRKPTAEELKA